MTTIENRTAFKSREGGYINYLIKMSRLENPKIRQGQAYNDYKRVCADCSRMRNQAKDILDRLGKHDSRKYIM